MLFSEELGYFGNIWVRQHLLEKEGDTVGGHAHYHDHITLLTHGSAEVTVEGFEPKVFKAPTFIVIRKEHRHSFRALEDNTNWYCVFALRNVDGDPTDIYDASHDPLSAAPAENDHWENKPIKRSTKRATIES